MTLNDKDRLLLYNRVASYLEDNSLEDLLEDLDIEGPEAVVFLFESGQIDPDIFDDLIGI